MISKELLRQVVTRQKEEILKPKQTIKRTVLEDILKWIKDDRVLILTGIRRCGKSTILKQLMEETKKWSYLNFEDERLIDFKAQDFELLNEVLIEFYGTTNIYFFDEIQNVEKFETFVRRLQDQGKKIIITGSNASLLSKEFGTRLTGRYKLFEIYPFSFPEFLSFKQIKFEKQDKYNINKKVSLLKLFEEYMEIGGLPEYIKNNDKEYVRTIFENILYKDIITRYSLKKEKILKELVNILATNATLPLTYNSLKNTLKLSNAITIKEYISYLNNSYLFFELLKFSNSIKEQLNSPRKLFLIDSVFNKICGLTFTPNKGRTIENIVFIELKRRNHEIFYYQNKYECDFITKEGNKINSAIQVCYELTEQNKEREINGLIEAMTQFELKEGLILTFEQTEEIKYEKKLIKVIPIMNWLLEHQ